jgi:hypothetical protein
MLKISIPDNNVQERKYSIDILFGEFLELEYEIHISSRIDDYEITLDNHNRILVEDHFFSKNKADLSYLDKKNIPDQITYVQNRFLPEKDLPAIYGTSRFEINEESPGNKTILCGVDIFASAFFMLTRWEEYVSQKRDKLNRFSGKYSCALANNFLHRPVVNEYCEMLWTMLEFLEIDATRKIRQFTPYITHDVDLVFKWGSFYHFIRTLTGDLLKRKSLAAFFYDLNYFIKTRTKAKKDPFDNFDYLMTLSEKNGFKSHFFFMSIEETSPALNYTLSHPFVKKLIGEINERGHYIGFHPDLNTYKNPVQWKKEYVRLQSFSPQKIAFGRQHYLQFEAPATWQIWNDMGMTWDSTLCYNDEPGFRTGSCYSYSVFNFLSRERLRLKEKSLIIMDMSLVFHHKYQSLDEILEKANDLIDRIRKYKGEFVFLWHNSCFNATEWKDYEQIYPAIINSLASNK